MPKDNISFPAVTGEGAGFDLAAATIRDISGGDSRDNKTTFKAVVLKPLAGSNPMSNKVKAALEGTAEPVSKQDRRGGFLAYRVRIIDENSPHLFLPDPCNPQVSSENKPSNEVIKDMHTLAFSRELLNYGDEVLIRVTPGNFSYNIEQAYITEVLMSNALRYKADRPCSQAQDLFHKSILGGIQPGAPFQGSVAGTPGGPSTAEDIRNAYPAAAAHPGLPEKIVEVANNVGIPDPGWLANLINFESGFDPTLQNQQGSDCWGLIQFCRNSGAKSVGVRWKSGEKPPGAFLDSGAVAQMKYVEAYMMKGKGKYKTVQDVYARVFFPLAMDYGDDFSIYGWYVSNKGQAAADKFVQQNPGIMFKGDYVRLANSRAGLPTVLPGTT